MIWLKYLFLGTRFEPDTPRMQVGRETASVAEFPEMLQFVPVWAELYVL